MCVLLARIIDFKRVGQLSLLPFKTNGRELASAFNPLQSRRLSDLLLSISAVLIVSLAVYLVKQNFESYAICQDHWQQFLWIFFIIAIFSLFKTLIGSLIGWVFEVSEEISIAQNQFFAYLSWLILPLFPLVIICAYLPYLSLITAYFLLVLLILGLTQSIFHVSVSIIKLPPSLGYNIFYLCALELAPAILLAYFIKSI